MFDMVPRRLDGPADGGSRGDPRPFLTAPCLEMPCIARFNTSSADFVGSGVVSGLSCERSLAALLSVRRSLMPLTVVSRRSSLNS
jgi:hypothetical protein